MLPPILTFILVLAAIGAVLGLVFSKSGNEGQAMLNGAKQGAKLGCTIGCLLPLLIVGAIAITLTYRSRYTMMKKGALSCLAVCSLILAGCTHNSKTPDPVPVEIVMETTMGNIELKLYDETPLHRDNFASLVKEGAYDSLLFHRVIENFMIQGGDPDSKNAEDGAFLGEGDRPYTVPAEFRIEEGIYHKRGVLAAAREGDDVNPEQASSAMQFYIVWGRVFDEEGLDGQQRRIDSRENGSFQMTEQMRETYSTLGGTPHLDGAYTVFGEVTKGLETVDAIQKVSTDDNDRPIENVRILKAYIKE